MATLKEMVEKTTKMMADEKISALQAAMIVCGEDRLALRHLCSVLGRQGAIKRLELKHQVMIAPKAIRARHVSASPTRIPWYQQGQYA